MPFYHFATAHDGQDSFCERDAADRGAIAPPSLARGIGDYRRHQSDYRHLLELPDYLLRDVGLTRTQVAAAARRRLF
jgi:uncharacterized protein YjiS (DUF1127 family)